jgi:MinD-like ATPase involved in chromosome partitioning or flagellar assembly
MYVVTFYSFKGGVGRTMALANIGVELARTGRRVLLVDFDLEAPGIETFNLPRPREDTPGIVDYITSYIANNEAPDVGEYIYECPQIGENGGHLWIMPAGRDEVAYGKKLHSIDWQDLYDRRGGYLMIEDMKAQWRQVLAPDYVLVDSRTGYTDESGICTRQLPDAVVIMFFPTEQNLRGLRKMIGAIGGEAHAPRYKQITLHFVTSNVPDLDDENEILESRMARFREALGYADLSATIHHYPSLAILNQEVFTRDRPKSRLVAEYRQLARAIVQHNLADREAALQRLEALLDSPVSESTDDEQLDRMAELHASDGDVLHKLSIVRDRQGRITDAVKLLSGAIQAGLDRPEALRRRAELFWLTEDPEGARVDICAALERRDTSAPEIIRLIRLLRKLDVSALRKLPDTLAISVCDARARCAIATELRWDTEALRTAEAILYPVREEKIVLSFLVMCLIGLRRFREALDLLGGKASDASSKNIATVFHWAMADWAQKGVVPQETMREVLSLHVAEPRRRVSANYFQCLAIAAWAVGERERAENFRQQSQQFIVARPAPEFTAWRYLTVPAIEFLKDLEELGELIEGANVLPLFMVDGKADAGSGAEP